MNIPRDKVHPPDAVQCDDCGGHGCDVCQNKGWLPVSHPRGRRCHREGCGKPIPPSQLALYCGTTCAVNDSECWA